MPRERDFLTVAPTQLISVGYFVEVDESEAGILSFSAVPVFGCRETVINYSNLVEWEFSQGQGRRRSRWKDARDKFRVLRIAGMLFPGKTVTARRHRAFGGNRRKHRARLPVVKAPAVIASSYRFAVAISSADKMLSRPRAIPR